MIRTFATRLVVINNKDLNLNSLLVKQQNDNSSPGV